MTPEEISSDHAIGRPWTRGCGLLLRAAVALGGTPYGGNGENGLTPPGEPIGSFT